MKDLAKQLRLILYRNSDSNTLTTEFERVLKACDCKYVFNIFESDRVTIADVSPYIQFVRIKQCPKRIYEVIPEDSPLKKYVKRGR